MRLEFQVSRRDMLLLSNLIGFTLNLHLHRRLSQFVLKFNDFLFKQLNGLVHCVHSLSNYIKLVDVGLVCTFEVIINVEFR